MNHCTQFDQMKRSLFKKQLFSLQARLFYVCSQLLKFLNIGGRPIFFTVVEQMIQRILAMVFREMYFYSGDSIVLIWFYHFFERLKKLIADLIWISLTSDILVFSLSFFTLYKRSFSYRFSSSALSKLFFVVSVLVWIVKQTFEAKIVVAIMIHQNQRKLFSSMLIWLSRHIW